jgi:vacuolar-type H+-ATPase subunit D/Vma8
MRENKEQKKKFLYGLNLLKDRREDVVDEKTSCCHTASRIYENVEKGLKLNKLCLIDGLENGKVT